MSHCFLGRKKLNRIEAILGRPVKSASVRGGNEHFWANVWLTDFDSLLVNYKTGEIIKDVQELNALRQNAFDRSWATTSDEIESSQAAEKAVAEQIIQWTQEFSA